MFNARAHACVCVHVADVVHMYLSVLCVCVCVFGLWRGCVCGGEGKGLCEAAQPQGGPMLPVVCAVWMSVEFAVCATARTSILVTAQWCVGWLQCITAECSDGHTLLGLFRVAAVGWSRHVSSPLFCCCLWTVSQQALLPNPSRASIMAAEPVTVVRHAGVSLAGVALRLGAWCRPCLAPSTTACSVECWR